MMRQKVVRGQILVLAAFSMVIVLGFAALAVDIGYYHSVRRHMQTATDAAAVAAATMLRNGGTYASATTAAQDIAKLNGFDTGAGNGVSLSAVEPTTAPYNTTNYVQVQISQPQPAFFLRVLGYSAMTVGTQAIAGVENGTGCIYALDPSRSQSIDFTGNMSISASCGVIDDSNSSTAMEFTGNGTITATSMGVVGSGPGYQKSGNITLTPTPVTKMAPAPDPLAAIPAPAVPSATLAAVTNAGSYSVSGNNQVVTVPAGVYGGGISIGGNSTQVTFAAGTYGNNITIGGNTASATFNPGQYQNTGGSDSIDISGNSHVTFNPGGSYTFYGPLSVTGNATMTLQPGLYLGGISIGNVNANVTFAPGTYILAGGGLSVTGNSTLSGTGVTFYNTSAAGFPYGPINLTGNEQAKFSAPTSGPLAGMLLFQDRSVAYSSSNGSTVTGNSSSSFDGAVYFPTTALTYTGNSSANGYTFLVADTLTNTGNSSMTIGANYSSLANGSPIKSTTIYQ